MGWYYTNGATRADIISQLTETRTWTRKDGVEVRTSTVAKCCVGNVLWIVSEQTFGERTERYLRCALLEKSGGDWGYKEIEETAHPYYYTCPLSYLDMAPVVMCKDWRDLVRARHARKKQAKA